ncbi:MAG TPA: VOC family protein, partial [Planctomycetota bacterium]|nr:VOC family protein [Planctomycetota bacterium]
AFGFSLWFSVPETGAPVRHARLRFGDAVVMLGTTRADDGMATPRTLGAATQALVVEVEDVDLHYARAIAAGAEVVASPADTDFGMREYHARDLEGHPWIFTAPLRR